MNTLLLSDPGSGSSKAQKAQQFMAMIAKADRAPGKRKPAARAR